MNVVLFPRLGQIAVDQVLEDHGEALSRTSTLDYMREYPESMSYAASGGSRISQEQLLEIRRLIAGAAEENGFPDSGSTKQKAAFDTKLAILFGEHPLFVPPEVLRDDVWAFLAVVIAPDVVRWRFGEKSRERFHGGVRNTLQRLWMRAWSLDRGVEAEDRWGLLRELTEDAFVQIVERPSIGGDRGLALALAEGWFRMSEKAGRGAMETIMRRATILVRVRNQIQTLSALEVEMLANEIDVAFETSFNSHIQNNVEPRLKGNAMPAEQATSATPSRGEFRNVQPEKPERNVLSRLRSIVGR